jgi:acetyl-CoA acetyltransferase
MRDAVIVSSSRTPLAKSHRGSFNITRPDDLAAHAIAGALKKVPELDPNTIEEVILGCGQPHGPQGHNVARVAALRAGLPVTTAGLTVNRFCNSGLQAIVQAAHMVMHEGVEAVIGGGVESITMMQRDNSPNPVVKQQHPGLYMVMGETAEVVAKRYNISREAQDEYSLISQQRVARAQQDGFFTGEIAPIEVTRAILDKRPATRSARRR